jgi:hypothetical protein
MRRAHTGRLPIVWGVQPPWSEVLLDLRQQANHGRTGCAISTTDDVISGAAVITHGLR